MQNSFSQNDAFLVTVDSVELFHLPVFRYLSEHELRNATSRATNNHFPNSYYKTAAIDFYQNYKPNNMLISTLKQRALYGETSQ